MRKILLIALLFWGLLLTGNDAHARRRTIPPMAVGMRVSPNGFGLNARYYFRDKVFLEGQHNWSKGTPNGAGRALMNGMLIHYNMRLAGPNVRLYVGLGGHYGSWIQNKELGISEDVAGFDWVIGTECIFPRSKIGMSVDVKPAYNNMSTAGLTFMPNNTVGLGMHIYISKKKRRPKYRGFGE